MKDVSVGAVAACFFFFCVVVDVGACFFFRYVFLSLFNRKFLCYSLVLLLPFVVLTTTATIIGAVAGAVHSLRLLRRTDTHTHAHAALSTHADVREANMFRK